MSKIPSHNDRAKAAEAKVNGQGMSGKDHQAAVQRQMFIDEVKRKRK